MLLPPVPPVSPVPPAVVIPAVLPVVPPVDVVLPVVVPVVVPVIVPVFVPVPPVSLQQHSLWHTEPSPVLQLSEFAHEHPHPVDVHVVAPVVAPVVVAPVVVAPVVVPVLLARFIPLMVDSSEGQSTWTASNMGLLHRDHRTKTWTETAAGVEDV